MKRVGLPLILLSILAAGCQSEAPPAAGLASLHLRVMAVPKQGVPAQSDQVQVYDAAARNQRGAYERLDYSSLDDIVVWAAPIHPSGVLQVPPPKTVNIGGSPGADHPIVPASVGQELILSNDASQAMNLYSVSDGNNFDLGTLAPGKQASYVIKSPGLIEILTDRFEQPVARVYAAPSPFVVETHSGAEVTLNNLPPGEYRVVSWHPRLPGTSEEVHLSAGQTQTETITVGVNSLPKISH